MKQRVRNIGKMCLLLGMIGIVYSIWCQTTGIAIPCFVYQTTGYYCPGCGVSRMCLALLRGNLRQAAECNLALFFVFPILLFVFGVSAYRYILTGKWEQKKWQDRILLILLIGLILFGVLRNLPYFSFLAPKAV